MAQSTIEQFASIALLDMADLDQITLRFDHGGNHEFDKQHDPQFSLHRTVSSKDLKNGLRELRKRRSSTHRRVIDHKNEEKLLQRQMNDKSKELETYSHKVDILRELSEDACRRWEAAKDAYEYMDKERMEIDARIQKLVNTRANEAEVLRILKLRILHSEEQLERLSREGNLSESTTTRLRVKPKVKKVKATPGIVSGEDLESSIGQSPIDETDEINMLHDDGATKAVFGGSSSLVSRSYSLTSPPTSPTSPQYSPTSLVQTPAHSSYITSPVISLNLLGAPPKCKDTVERPTLQTIQESESDNELEEVEAQDWYNSTNRRVTFSNKS